MPDAPPDQAPMHVQVLAPLSSAPAGEHGGLIDGLRALVGAAPFAAVGTGVMAACTALAPYAYVLVGELLKVLSLRLPEWSAAEKAPLRHFLLCLLSGAMVQFYRMWTRSHPPTADGDPT